MKHAAWAVLLLTIACLAALAQEHHSSGAAKPAAVVSKTRRRADLEKNPRNPRSLFGLMESLIAQKKTADADWVHREFQAAWKNADVTLRVEDL